MNECPQGTCNGVEHIKEQMITKATIKWAVGLIVSVMIAFGIAWGQLQNKVSKVETEVVKNTTHFEHITKTLEEIKQNQLNKGDIYKAIRKAMKPGSTDE